MELEGTRGLGIMSDSGLRDSVHVEPNPGPVAGAPADQPPPLPTRPAESADPDRWRSYLVALGADQGWVSQFDVPELIEMAARFGG